MELYDQKMNSVLLAVCLFAVVIQCAGKSNENLVGCPINLARDEFLHTRGQKCYQFVMHQKNHWKEARASCQSKGGDMVTIRDETEEQFIASALRAYNVDGNVWIGLSDEAKEGEYRWVTGDISTYFNWSPGEPSFLHNFEDCVSLHVDSGAWSDHPCELPFNSYPWICEYPVQTTTTSTTTASTITSTTSTTTSTTTDTTTTATTTSSPATYTTTTSATVTPLPVETRKPTPPTQPRTIYVSSSGVTSEKPGKDLIGK